MFKTKLKWLRIQHPALKTILRVCAEHLGATTLIKAVKPSIGVVRSSF